MALGFRVYTKIRRVDPEVVAALGSLAVPNLSDATHGLTVLSSDLQPIYRPQRTFFGTAITVVMTPGDGLMFRKALDLASDQDVIVANSFGDTTRAILGGNVCASAAARGVRGFVVDGAVRDRDEARGVDLPVIARTVTPRSGTSSEGWGEVNVPTACGGVVVYPGDVVVAGEEGVVIVQADFAEEVLEAALKVQNKKGSPADIKERLHEAARTPTRGVDKVSRALAARGGVIVDEEFSRRNG